MFKVSSDGGETGRPQRASRVAMLGVAALIASFTAPAARAQLNSGYSGSSSLSNVEGEEVYRSLRAFGNCYAQRNAPQALALIATDPASPEERETYRRIFRREVQCLGDNVEMQMTLPMVRGAIAEGLYRSRAVLPQGLALAAPALGAEIRKLSEAARCYVAGHRDQARALIEESVPGSQREHEMLNGMVDDFFQCLPAAARGRRFLSTQLRYSFAEALYRMPAAEGGQR
jgi:hypothetical protein